MPTASNKKEKQSPSSSLDGIVIQAKGLTKQFNEEVAVKEVAFEVQRGTIFGFIGPSGSGKTTTIRLLMGVYRPTGGEMTVLNARPSEFTQETRARIGYMPQLSVLYPNLSVWQNLTFAASIYGVELRHRRKHLEPVLDFVELSEHRDKLVRNISGGMRRRLSLAAALVHKPELLFLDEPTTGVDPVLRRKFWNHFKALQNEGQTLFVTTQYVAEAAYCDTVGVLAEGRLLVADTPQGLRRRAFGGEVVDLRTAERMSYHHRELIRDLPCVKKVIGLLGESEVRIVVEEAGTAIPALLDWSRSQELTVETIEEYLPPFDDVFVELIKENSTDG